MDLKDIDTRFTYHTPKEGQPQTYELLRRHARELALLIDAHVPDSREKSLSITALEEAVFWANAGIARNG